MTSDVILVLDDRAVPPPEIEAMLGRVRFRQIIRRRRRLVDEITAAVPMLGGHRATVEILVSDEQAHALAHRIENRGPGPVFLRLPSCIMPMRMSALSPLLDKARYALETMMLSALHHDEAVALLTAGDAVAVLRAQGPQDRRGQFLRLAETAPAMIDHLDFVDLRAPRALLRFLAGSTEARHFNALKSEDGVLHKSSADRAKMRAEHGMFHVAPDAVKRFFIPTFDFWETRDQAGYAMEHMAIPDAALQLIHGAFDPDSYGLLLDQIFAFLAARPADPQGRSPGAAWDSQITGKMRSRLDAFMDLEVGRKLDALMRAAGPAGGIRDMQARAETILGRARARDTSTALVFSHGDPCFSNILFDRRLGLMRLIDPRGATDPADAMMHPLYDVAKVSHSALGGYDFINNDLFRCTLGGELDLHLSLGDRAADADDTGATPVPDGPPDWAAAAFRARLSAAGHDLQATRAVELSLFLSMLPLHADHPRKLAGFVLTAARLITDLENGDPS
jgi:hypothetical protein